MRRTTLAVALAFASVCPAAGAAEGKDVEIPQLWGGRIKLELAKEAPAKGYLTSQKALDKLWKAWGAKGKAPKVDFDKEVVLVEATRSSRIGIQPKLSDKGDLTWVLSATADLTADAGYLIVTVPRAGVKTIKGKKVEKD